jgi:hypothetical protein
LPIFQPSIFWFWLSCFNSQFMRSRRLIACFGLLGLWCAPAKAEEYNFWPLSVEQTLWTGSPANRRETRQMAGPLLFSQTTAGHVSGGIRPLFVFDRDLAGHTSEFDFLYPLLTKRTDQNGSRWSLLDLAISSQPNPAAPSGDRVHSFDLWPFYFSKDTGDPATSYHALFPIHGQVINRFGDHRISWTLFPFYGVFERNGVTTTTVPWPIIKILRGDGNHGYAIWPLLGYRAKAGAYREQFYLWPLIYKNEAKLWQPKPEVSLGVLPFYARDESADSLTETYAWPFFGYIHRTAPYRYDETDWFWPLLVQGRGDDRRINRWAPFYTHSVVKGDDERWLLWPLFRQEQWTDNGLTQNKTQFLYFFYWSLRQHSARNPALPPAQKTHLWPFFSYWDDGANHRQFQLLSPFEVFFQDSEPMRRIYSPLPAIYRYERFAPDDTHASLLWNAVTWRRTPQEREFHVGPLFSVRSGSGIRKISLLSGLIGLKRAASGGNWKLFLFDFSSKRAQPTSTAPSP